MTSESKTAATADRKRIPNQSQTQPRALESWFPVLPDGLILSQEEWLRLSSNLREKKIEFKTGAWLFHEGEKGSESEQD